MRVFVFESRKVNTQNLQFLNPIDPILLWESKVFLKYAAFGFSEEIDTDSPDFLSSCDLLRSLLAIVDFILRLDSELWLSALLGDLLLLWFLRFRVFGLLCVVLFADIQFDFVFAFIYAAFGFELKYPFFIISCILLLSVSVRVAWLPKAFDFFDFLRTRLLRTICLFSTSSRCSSRRQPRGLRPFLLALLS